MPRISWMTALLVVTLLAGFAARAEARLVLNPKEKGYGYAWSYAYNKAQKQRYYVVSQIVSVTGSEGMTLANEMKTKMVGQGFGRVSTSFSNRYSTETEAQKVLNDRIKGAEAFKTRILRLEVSTK